MANMTCFSAVASPMAPSPSFGPGQAFFGAQLRSLYGVHTVQAAPGKRQAIVAIVVAFTYTGILDDLRMYWSCVGNFPGTAPPTVSVVTLASSSVRVFDAAWAQETCLDVQMVCAVNPNAAIWVVEAASNSLAHMLAAVDHAANVIRADVVSMSWGTMDSPALAPFGARFANTRVSYCAASGDSNTVSWPSVAANCVSVGGTSLYWTPSGASAGSRTETTWTSAGCGYASSVLQPAYQHAVPSIEHKFRAVPDLSLVANPRTGAYVVFKGQWYAIGGTSVATPIFAGMLSLANQARINAGKPTLTTVYSKTARTNVQARLYSGGPSRYAANFNDVATGTNLGSVGGATYRLATYVEGPGYQLPTGLGSPHCESLCSDLLAL
jgi:subtilase family serine protease